MERIWIRPKTYLIKVMETEKKSKDKDNCVKCVLMKPNLMHQLGHRYQLTDTHKKRWWEDIKQMTEKKQMAVSN